MMELTKTKTATADFHSRLDNMPMNNMAFNEKEALFSYNKHDSILNFIFVQAAQFPNKMALVDNKRTFTYRQLINVACSLAEQFAQRGLRPDSATILHLKPSCEVVLIILAVLICNAHYVPVDPAFPEQRVQDILTDCKPRLIITSSQATYFSKYNVVHLDELDFSTKEKVSLPSVLPTGETATYMIYTSGSTGRPKGILIPHHAVNNHMQWMCKEFNFNHNDRFLLKTPLTFDPSVWEIFVPLYLGATLYIAESGVHAQLYKLIEHIKRHHISVLQLVPFALHNLLSEPNITDCTSLRYIFVGGESLTKATKSKYFDTSLRAQLVNLYGPSEATIDSTFHYVSNTEEDIEHNYIGRPIANVEIYILNKNLAPCAIQEAGEMYIAGESLAIGYLNRDYLNAKAFRPNPFSTQFPRMYKTGDIAKWADDSHKIEYLGREDNQVKINGVRIEIESIKKAVLKHKQIYDCVLKKETNATHQYSYLACYLIAKDPEKVNVTEVKQHLAAKLPEYMLPKKYYLTSKPNVTLNGKIDLKDLMDDAIKPICAPCCRDRDDIIRTLCEIWKQLFHLDIVQTSVNFYDLGGDSISSYLLSHEINQTFCVEIEPERFITLKTIEDQADFIQKHAKQEKPSKDSDAHIIALNSPARKTAFFIHPVGGTVFWFTHLADMLDKEIQLYAIQDPGISTGEVCFNSIQEMADFYTNLIVSKQPQGPYLLGGASFGATVAIEIAENLIQRGAAIDSVLIFDGWAIYPSELQNKDYFLQSMLRQQSDWKEKFNRDKYDFSIIDDIFKIQNHRLQMLFNYQMHPIPYHIDIFKAKTLMPVFQSIDHPSNHWEKYAKDFSVYPIDGNHESIFLADNAKKIADVIRQYAKLKVLV